MPRNRTAAAYANRVISQLTGTVAHVRATGCVLEVGGVGFDVNLTPTHALSLRTGTTETITTALVVREDALTLYGFRDAEEREVFDLLTGISGVGPKLALGILGHLNPEQLARAIDAEDVTAFKQVSGVGPKTAKLICVQLKGKLAPVPAAGAVAAPTRSLHDDVVDALVGLGTPAKQAQDAVARAAQDAAAAASVPTLLRAALRELGGAR